MEFLNAEGKKLRKKDSIVYYKSKKELIKIPEITEEVGKIKEFVKLCVSYAHEDSDSIVEELWEEYTNKKAGLMEIIDIKIKETRDEGDKWGSLAYYRASKTIGEFELPIVSGTQMMKLKGIGKGIGKLIDDYIAGNPYRPAKKFDFEADVF